MPKNIKNFLDIKDFDRKLKENIEKLELESEEKNKDQKNHVTVAISPYHRQRFKEYCSARGLNMKDALEEYIDSLFLRGVAFFVSIYEMSEWAHVVLVL